MIIEFRTANHRSIKEEQVLSFEVGHKGANYGVPDAVIDGGKHQVLTALGIYGANASGKSNVLDALLFMSSAVLDSYNKWDPVGGIKRDPFAWGGDSEPSMYELTFMQDGAIYNYGFVLDDQHILEEWLMEEPHGKRERMLFKRDEDSVRFGKTLKGENKMIQQLTRPNALFLSTAAQANHLQLTTIYSHISAIAPPMHQYKSFVELPVKMLGVAVVDIMMAVKKRGPDWTPRAKELLAFADLGLVDFKVEDESLYLNHGTNETPRWLLFEEESNGTQHFFVQLFGVLSRLHFGTLLVVDEIENNLHPTLVARIIKMFQNKETNPNRAQLLFTTHNTHLLSHKEEGEPLIRRDQIWLTEKDNQGATTLYPLTDYSARKNENLEKGYLQGRYGGVPYLVDFVLNEAS